MLTTSELTSIIRKIAPADFGSHPVYVCLASEMPAELRPRDDVWGYHARGLDIVFQQWLTRAERWHGRGPAIVVNDLSIVADAETVGGDDAELVRELIDVRLLGTAFHEAAHVLSDHLDFRPLPSPIATEIREQSTSKLTKFLAADHCTSELPAPWDGHEANFIRVLVHVAMRGERITGIRIPDQFLFTWRNYELSRLAIYRQRMEQEIESFDSTVTFADLQLCRPPEALVDQWKSDLHRWWNDDPSDTGMMQLVAAMSPYVCPVQ